MVGMAVLGCGRIGRMHARNLARHPRAKLVMVFDVLAEAAQQTAAELDVRIARSVDEVLSAADAFKKADAEIDKVLKEADIKP